MITFPILKLSFSDTILRCRIEEQEPLRIDGIQVLTEAPFKTAPGILYIASASAVASSELLVSRSTCPVPMLLIAGDAPSLDPLFSADLPSGPSLFTCNLSLEGACSRAFACCFEFNSWFNRLNTLSQRSKDIQALLSEGAAKLRAPLFLLNSGYRLIASNVDYSFENSHIHRLLMDGYLSSESIDELTEHHLLRPVNMQADVTLYESLLDTGHYAILALLKYRTNVFGRLLVLSKYGADNAALRDYTKLLARVIQEYSLLNNREQFESDAELSALIADLIDRKISGQEELKNRLFRLPALLQPQYHCALITFEPREEFIPIGRITHSLKQIFPLSNVAMYQDELIVLSGDSKISGGRNKSYDEESLSKLLERFDAYAAIGNSTKFLSSIRTSYLQCRTTIRLGKVLSANPKQRIFHSADFMLPLLVDLCAQYGYDFHENNLIYLCTPKYTMLKRHDIEQGDDLCTILNTYIRTNCNTSQTARELYLHRNTVINKLDRIEEIIGGKLTDWNLQCQLMLSAMILDYAEKYRQEDLLHVKEKYSG